jgi:hypothetical protein
LCSDATDCVFNARCYADAKTLVDADNPTTTDLLLNPAVRDLAFVDVDGDGKLEMCDPGEWINSEARIIGTVTNVSGDVVVGALVKVVGTNFSAVTAADGTYTIEGVPEGVYDLTASKAPYADDFSLDTDVYAEVTVDFVLSHPSDVCEADCSYISDSVCHADCQGKSGCWFYDDTTLSVCDGQGVGFVKNYGGGQVVECCTGQPYEKVVIPAQVDIDAEKVFRVVKVVQLPDGRLGKMVVYTFR